MVDFELQRPVLGFRDGDEVHAWLMGAPGRKLVFRLDKDDGLPDEVRSALRLVYDESGHADSPHAIGVWTGPTEEPR
jgi:hypothetical protein